MLFIEQEEKNNFDFSVCVGFTKDRAERHDLKSKFFAVHSPFIIPFFLGGKRKGKKINQIRDFRSCLSGGSLLKQ